MGSVLLSHSKQQFLPYGHWLHRHFHCEFAVMGVTETYKDVWLVFLFKLNLNTKIVKNKFLFTMMACQEAKPLDGKGQ